MNLSQLFFFAEPGKYTRIIVRRVLAEPSAICAGGIPQVSFAMFKTCMNTSRVGRAKLRPFCGWEVEAIVNFVARKARGAEVVWKKPNLKFTRSISCEFSSST